MIVIDHLDERLYFASLGDTFLAHSRGDFAGVTLDASDQGVAEGMHLCAVVVGLEDHGLAAGIATSGDECDFARFQDYRLAAVEAREWEGSTHFGIFESVVEPSDNCCAMLYLQITLSTGTAFSMD